MTFTALIVVCGLLGLLFFIAAIRRLRRRRVMGGMAHGATALIFFLAAACAVLIGSSLRTYQRLSYEQPAGELQLSRVANRQFDAVLSYPDGERANFPLRGDEWQVDARVLKWHAFANLVGFDTAYRLERISGRYSHIEDERTEPRTVYDLHAPGRIDPWELIHRYRTWVPWMDALYGSATFLPMADGALYEIKVSQSGLVARPLNQAAREAVGSWH
ncbi:MAG TPA: hypothetical protein VK523_02770 [Steroidobacteraceae bacterium]|nr:hypothetical protein [Steroidobacteraceae bacterium]